jgi:hypothetical protein
MRIGSLVLVIWLLIGVLAAFQRDYFKDSTDTCNEVSDTVLTIVAGPLNYVGVDPDVECEAPEPS